MPHLIAIGSIAHWADERSVLWGCGLIDETITMQHPPKTVLAVRGKRTRDLLTKRGIPCPDTIGDVGLFFPEIVPASTVKTSDVGIVPHYVDLESPFVSRCRAMGVRVIDPTGTIEGYVAALTSCRKIISSSLHGIVLAHAYGMEAAWVKISDRVHGDGIKFFDYFSSLEISDRDVPQLHSKGSTVESMFDWCWKPTRLPDLEALRTTLLSYVPHLDAVARIPA